MTTEASNSAKKERTKATLTIIENEDGTVNIETVFEPPVSEDVEKHLAADVAIAMIEGVFGEKGKPVAFGPGEEPVQ